MGKQPLDGDPAFEPAVPGLVDLAHAAASEEDVEAVGPDPLGLLLSHPVLGVHGSTHVRGRR